LPQNTNNFIHQSVSGTRTCLSPTTHATSAYRASSNGPGGTAGGADTRQAGMKDEVTGITFSEM